MKDDSTRETVVLLTNVTDKIIPICLVKLKHKWAIWGWAAAVYFWIHFYQAFQSEIIIFFEEFFRDTSFEVLWLDGHFALFFRAKQWKALFIDF